MLSDVSPWTTLCVHACEQAADRAEGWPRPSQTETAPSGLSHCPWATVCSQAANRGESAKLRMAGSRRADRPPAEGRAGGQGDASDLTRPGSNRCSRGGVWGSPPRTARRGHQPPRRPPGPVSLSPGTLSFQRNAAWRRAAGSRAAEREGHQTPPDLPQLGGETRRMSAPGPVQELQGQRNNI